MKSRTFRFEDSDLELLKQLAEDMGCTQVEALRQAIRRATQEQPPSNTDEIPVLVEQLQVKDRQIENLQKLLDQEQQLHMATRQAVKQIEAPKPGFWRRVFYGE